LDVDEVPTTLIEPTIKEEVKQALFKVTVA
jgi:hypothetical protein